MSGEALSHAIQRRVIQEALFIVKALDWTTLTATVEFKHAPGLLAKARIATVSGAGGTLYPPIDVGDVLKGEIHGPDLTEMVANRQATEPKNAYLYDQSEVTIGLGLYMATGEPAGRKAATVPNPKGWLLVTSDGSEVRYDPANKEWVWKLATGGKMYVGGKTNAKAVLVNGDSNAAGGVGSTQTKLYVGDP